MKQKYDANKDEIRKTIIKVVGFMLCIVILIASLGFYEHGLLKRRSDVNDILKVYSYNQCNNVNNWIDKSIVPLQSVKTYIESVNIKTTSDLQNMLDYANRNFVNYESGVYVGNSNNEFLKGNESHKEVKGNVCDEYWYKEGLTRVDVSLGTVHKDNDGNYMVSATGMINNDNEIEVIGADVLLSTINAEIDDKYVNPDFNTIVTDRKGNIIASKDESIIGKNLYDTNNKILSSCADRIKLKSYTSFNIDDTSIELNVTKCDEWVVISYVSQKEINGKYILVFIKILVIVSSVSIIALAILNMIIKYICNDFEIVKKE